MRRIDGIVLASFLSFFVGHSYARDTRNLHLLAITSGHFGGPLATCSPMSLPGAHLGGRLLLSHLASHLGATTSTLLRSDESRFVSRQDVFDALGRLAAVVNRTPGSDIAIIYILGHGYGDGIGWNYFLQPGNVCLRGNPSDINRFDVEELGEHLIYIGEVVDTLKAMDTRYVLLIDACYEGEAEDMTASVLPSLLSREATSTISDVQKILAFMNQFHDPNPVVFSAPPGSVVPTVPIPRATGAIATQRIGPLARRVLLSLEKVRGTLPVTERLLVETLVASELDMTTAPAISFAKLSTPFELVGASPPADIQILWGTAEDDDFYEVLPEQPTEELSASVPREQVRSAVLAFEGDQGDWVTDGRSYRFESNDCPFVIDTWEPDRISLRFCNYDGDWNVSFAVPSGMRFERNTYENVAGYLFQEQDQAALDITGAGSGCNEIAGEFTVDTVEYIGESPATLSISFTQYCDDEVSAMTGTFTVER